MINIANNFPVDYDDQFDPRVGGYTPEELYGTEADEIEPDDDAYYDPFYEDDEN